MERDKKKILIYGGAFNPPHLGHAAILRVAMKNFSCGEVWVMPTGDRRDKKFSVSAEDRFQMTKLWLEEIFPDPPMPVVLSRMEIDRGNPTFTHDTHRELSGLYPEREFYFLFGGDALSDVRGKWHKGDEVYKNLNFLIVNRPGYDLPVDLPIRSIVLKESGSSISSTNVRNAIKAGQDASNLVPAKVWRFIQERWLYRD